MNGLVTILLTLVAATQCQQSITHKYNTATFDKIQSAGHEAEKVIAEANIITNEDKLYLNLQANEYYHHMSNAIFILNRAVFVGRLGQQLQKELTDVTKYLIESSCSVLVAINRADPLNLKNKLKTSIELVKNNIKTLSRVAFEADGIEGGKPVEYSINRATKALQRGFYQILSRYTFLRKNSVQIENYVKASGTKANSEINEVSGNGKNIVRVLKNPVLDLVDLVDRVIQKVDELFFSVESVPYTDTLRDISYKLMNLYGELVHLKIEFEYLEDGTKLKEDFKKLFDKSGVLFKEVLELISDDTGKEIIEEILPQTETGVQLLFYYLDLAKQK